MADFNQVKSQFMERAWPQVRRLLVFQVKLLIDIARDFVFSALSILACFIDLVQQNQGENSAFARVMELGRRLEHKVNLFEQHSEESRNDPYTVDALADTLEQKLRR